MDNETLAAENKALRDINARQKADAEKSAAENESVIDFLRGKNDCSLIPAIMLLEQSARRLK